MKVEFLDSGKTLFVDLVKTNGDPRPWSTDRNLTPHGGAGMNQTHGWACGHSAQLQYRYWFFFKTASASGSCEGGNYENTVYASDGFKNAMELPFGPRLDGHQKLGYTLSVVGVLWGR